MAEAVAIIRGDGIPTEFILSGKDERKQDFITRVAEDQARRVDSMIRSEPMNTLTIEYVFKP